MSKPTFFALSVLLAGCLDEATEDELNTETVEQHIDGSHGDDIVLLGSTAANTGIVTVFTNDNGTRDVINSPSVFAEWAKAPGVKRVKGDFNRDGRMDLALAGGPGWNTLPTAFSNGDGTWYVTNNYVGASFNIWASSANVTALVGDYNKDGFSDIALTGAPGWASIPVAFSAGGGYYQITNFASGLASYASMAGAKPLVGDYNKDGYSDIAVVGMGGFPFIPVSFAAGGGTWQVTVGYVGSFNSFASITGVTVLPGDYNKDGFSDIALSGGGLSTIPVAFSAGGGSFQVTNQGPSNPTWGTWATYANVQTVGGDFNADGYSDIAMLGGPGWLTMPVAFSAGGGAFQVTNQWAGWNDYQLYSTFTRVTGVIPLVGDFAPDGSSDIALAGIPSLTTVPTAWSVGSGWWAAYHPSVALFPQLSAAAGGRRTTVRRPRELAPHRGCPHALPRGDHARIPEPAHVERRGRVGDDHALRQTGCSGGTAGDGDELFELDFLR